MDHRDNILKIVQDKGPLLPSRINKELRTNVLFASAMLAEMVDSKKLRLTSLKVGGSPLYYCEGQEPVLEQFASKLAGIEHNTFNQLKSSKILRDRDQDPQTRVALREIKDFAVPLEVTANETSDLFWKYYLVSDEEASSLINEYINRMVQQAATPPEQNVPKPESPAPEPKKEVQATFEQIEPASKTSLPVETKEAELQSSVTSVKMTQLDESDVPEFSYRPAVSFSTQIDTDAEVKIDKGPAPEPEPETVVFPEDDDFFNRVKAYFDSNGIEIDEFDITRKGSEYDFTIRLPSNVGMLNYYCKAKAKAKLNDGDLSTAYVQGQIKKLPILFLAVGDMTKRAEELLSQEFKNMFVKKI